MRAHRGFTLLELMVVVALIALATATVVVGLRDSNHDRLETEALRLGAMLDAARAQSRTSGVPLLWQPDAEGFGLRPADAAGAAGTTSSVGTRKDWLHAGTTAQIVQPVGAPVLVLGPEPLTPPQRIDLRLGEARLSLATDGLGPFSVERGSP